MFQSRNNTLNRSIKTSQPKFRRITHQQTETDVDLKKSTFVNFPQFHKNNAFDTSKQNLLYEQHLNKVKSACKIDKTTIVSKYLNSIRKNFDDMNKISKRQLSTMQTKRRQIQVIKINNKIFVDKRVQVQKKIEERLKEAKLLKQRHEDIQMEKKTLEHIIERMKKDHLIHKQFNRIKQEEMKKRQKRCKELDQNLIAEDEKISKLMSQLQKVKKIYNDNKLLREKKYEDFEMKIEDVVQRDKFIQERKDRTFELRSIELNDTLDQKNIHMRQIILSHKVADSLLQFKVSNLLKDYSDVQASFNLIKNKTSVDEPRFMVSKFFSYEPAAEKLLKIIRQNEQKLNALTYRKQMLSSTYRDLINQNLSSLEERHSTCYQDNLIQQIVAEINRKTLQINQIHTLISRNMHEFNIQSPKEADAEERSKLLLNYTVNSFKTEKHIKSDKKIATMGVRLKKVIKQLTTDELSNSLKELEQMRDSNLTEEDFLNTERRLILKKGFSIKQVNNQNNAQK